MINIELEKYEKAFNTFNNEKITDNLSNYIKDECQYIYLEEEIILNIKGNLTKKQQEKLTNTIHKHYKKLSDYYKTIDKYDNLYRIVFILIGASLIISSNLFDSFISEILLISGWVPIWEAIHDFLFEGVKRERTSSIYNKLANCKVIFNEEDKNDL